jgi:hypothetical protein
MQETDSSPGTLYSQIVPLPIPCRLIFQHLTCAFIEATDAIGDRKRRFLALALYRLVPS